MIVIKILGGLGNQMFQYAAAKALAHKKKKSLYLNINPFYTNYKLHTFGLDHFNINNKKLSLNKIRIIDYLIKKNIGFKLYAEPSFEYREDFFQVKGNHIYLNGFFQSEKYFEDIASIIREDFKITVPLSLHTKEMLDVIRKVNSVSLHVRRGDYVGNSTHEVCDLAYYEKAIEIIKEKVDNPVFFVFSDDIEWVKQNIKIQDSKVHFIDFNDASRNYEDLELMSNCQHNIIANSSFSWWGAWLNANQHKMVIAPQRWFKTDKFNTKDIIPQSWIKI